MGVRPESPYLGRLLLPMNSSLMKLGVIADTHVPDKAKALHPRVLPILRQSGVSAILHAGDITSPGVLDALGEIAPVYAVLGNRDWVFLRRLPLHRTLTFDGVTLGLTHSHGGLRNYIIGKFHYIAEGYNLDRFKPRLLEAFPTASVIVFGHTHRPLIRRVNGKLFFNPGSTCLTDKRDIPPSLGLLYIHPGGQTTGEIVQLR
jgi:putative phosphoesterase